MLFNSTSMKTLSWNYIQEKWSHTGFQKYFRNLGWMFFGRIASMAISFIATAYIARNLGPANYGELSYAISFVSIFSFIAVLGIDQVLYRDLIHFPEKKNQYMGSAFVLRIGASVIAILLCTFFAVWFSPKDVSFFLIFLLSLSFIFNTFQIINYEFQANVQSKFPSLLTLYVTILLNILKILVIVFGQGVIYLAFVLLLESVFYAAGYLYYRAKFYGMISQWSFDKEIAKKILHDSWPLIFSSAFALIYARIDQIMIKNMMDASSVGLYDAAVRLSEVWYFIPSIISSSLFPAIINAKNTSEKTYYKRIQKLALLLVGLSVLISLPVMFLSDFIVRLVYGQAFIGAVLILQVYIWSNVATSLNSVVNLYLVTENFKKMLLFSTFAGMLTNVVLNIYFIPKYGTIGAAYATLISYAVPFLSIFVLPRARKLLKI
ncbi:MAG: flippase [Patescibacteria group bacterium]